MRIGVVKEIKPAELRVALTPAGAEELVRAGHEVLVEEGAGTGSGFADDAYAATGARIMTSAQAVWESAQLLTKVKEPVGPELALLREGLTLFTYLHLAAAPQLTEALMRSGATGVAYETVEDASGHLPLLAPMSEIAGRLAGQVVAHYLTAPMGGRGLLAGGAPGVAPARVLVLGGGVVGVHAARVARGMGAEVTVLERSDERLRYLDDRFEGSVRCLMSDAHSVMDQLGASDAVIGAVLVHGAAAPKLVTRSMLSSVPERAVLVDVAIDQGGCFETSRPTTHEEPTYVVDGALHYCVANMPGAVPVTSTRALTNATLPYLHRLADGGLDAYCRADRGFARGVNVRDHEIVHPAVAEAFGAGR
ncbi:MAG TPA: alanine dehydrogenase [Acidimicrobiales bacterium]|nr:alanine dehydrogenase [Acidimicrobiales bacterium]